MRTLRSAAMPRNPSVRSASCAPSRGAPDLAELRRAARAMRAVGLLGAAQLMAARARKVAVGATWETLAAGGDAGAAAVLAVG
jgi:hypothetical protein